jgi:starch synthase
VYIAFVASECAPVAQAGGLGDVVFGLSGELEKRGHAVDIILPKYDCMRYDHIWGLSVAYEDLPVAWYGGFIHCTVWFGFVHGRRCFFIDPHSQDEFFNRGQLYGSHDDVMRFAFFSKAALEFMLRTNRRPDVIHCHDWQTALVPVLLFEIYAHFGMQDQRVCYTVHNFAHQGVTGESILWATGLNYPERYFDELRLRDNGNPLALNLMKGGIVYSNFVTTVSPRHAWETMNTDQGMGLGHTLYTHREKFGGVLNGIDYDVWNPAVDRMIPEHYSVETLEPKYAVKDALRDRLWLRKGFRPMLTYIGRLDRQKGVELIHHALFYGLARGLQVVIMGVSPDPEINAHFRHLKGFLNDNPDCHIELAFNVELSHLMYAGADMLLMPSFFEPCGLAQMIALRYGTIPIVRPVGGLVDTVFDRDYSDRPAAERNGYVFEHTDNTAVESALDRAIELWYTDPTKFRALMINGMRQDHSWAEPGGHYVNIYRFIAAHKPWAVAEQTADNQLTPTVKVRSERVARPAAARVERSRESIEVLSEEIETLSDRADGKKRR